MKKTKQYVIQIESQNMMVMDLVTTKKEFDNQRCKILKEYGSLYCDNNYREEMGADFEIINREFEQFYETQWVFVDGTTRIWFIKRTCKNGYVFAH